MLSILGHDETEHHSSQGLNECHTVPNKRRGSKKHLTSFPSTWTWSFYKPLQEHRHHPID